MRATARIHAVKPRTVERVRERMGKHAERVFNHHLRGLTPREVQLDELWSFVHAKQGRLPDLERLEAEWGDCWVWVAFDPETKVVLGFVLGKRTKDRAIRLLKRVHEVLADGCFPLFTSDEYAGYQDALVEVFGVTVRPERNGTRGRFPNARRKPHPRLKHATVHKHRKRRRVTKVTRRLLHGDPAEVDLILAASPVSNTVNTSGVERQNGTLRATCGPLRRKTLGFAKRRPPLRHGLTLTLGYTHYCRPHSGLRQRRRGRPPRSGKRWDERTPMMALGKTDHVWTLQEWTLFRVPGRNVRCFYGAA